MSTLHHSPPDSSEAPLWVDRVALLGLACLSLLLALPAHTPMADYGVFGTLDMVSRHDAPWWQLFQYPAPDNSWGARPISVGLLKLYLSVFGPHAPPSGDLLVTKSVLTILWFGLASRAWLRAYGFKREAPFAMLGSVMVSPALFSAWQLTQFDTLAAGALLFACALLTREHLCIWRRVLIAALLSLPLFLKESSALTAFGFLGAASFVYWRRGNLPMAKRHGLLLALGVSAWFFYAWKMFTAEGPPGRSGLLFLGRLPIVEHMALQLMYLVSAAGALLITCLLWRRSGRLNAGSRWIWLGPTLAVAWLLISPLLDYHSHYETAFYVTRWGSPVALLLSVALIHRVLMKKGELGLTMAAGGILGSVGPLALMLLAGATTREDLASRIFIPALPLLLGLAARAIFDGLRVTKTLSASPARLMRTAHVAGASALIWYAAVHPFNMSQEWQARGPVDTEGRRALAEAPLGQSTILFNNTSQWLGRMDLAALGAEPRALEVAHFTPTPAWFEARFLPTVKSQAGVQHPERARQAELPIYLYWLANRSLMDEAANDVLQGDLSWTRCQVGLLSPLDFFPELLAEEDMLTLLLGGVPEAPEDRTSLANPWGDTWPDTRPAHNWMEDIRMTTYRAGPSTLTHTLKDDVSLRWQRAHDYARLPLDLLSLPRRLMSGAPLIERYRWEAMVYGPKEARVDG